jgi:hypothetical protein
MHGFEIEFAVYGKYTRPMRGKVTGSAFVHILTLIRRFIPAKTFVTFTPKL